MFVIKKVETCFIVWCSYIVRQLVGFVSLRVLQMDRFATARARRQIVRCTLKWTRALTNRQTGACADNLKLNASAPDFGKFNVAFAS